MDAIRDSKWHVKRNSRFYLARRYGAYTTVYRMCHYLRPFVELWKKKTLLVVNVNIVHLS